MPRGTGSLMCGMWSKQKLPHDGQQHGKQQESGKHISFTWLHTNGIAIVLSVPAPASCDDKNANLALTMFSWTLNTPKRQQCNMCIKMDLWVFFFVYSIILPERYCYSFTHTTCCRVILLESDVCGVMTEIQVFNLESREVVASAMTGMKCAKLPHR